MRHPVQYSQSLTPISLLCTLCVLINTQPILLSSFTYFATQLKNTGDLTTLFSLSRSWAGSRAESDGEVAEVERGLTREDRMTARIIKNVLPLLLPEGIAAIPPSLASNNSLVTGSAAPDESRLPTNDDIVRSEAVWPTLLQCSDSDPVDHETQRLFGFARQPQSLNSRRPSFLSNH